MGSLLLTDYVESKTILEFMLLNVFSVQSRDVETRS